MIIIGDSGAVEQPIELVEDATSGSYYVRNFRGPTAAVLAKLAEFRGLSDTREFRDDFGVAELSVRIGGTLGAGGTPEVEAPVVTIEIDMEEQTQSLFLNPTYLPLSRAAVRAIRTAIEQPPTEDANGKTPDEQIEEAIEAAAGNNSVLALAAYKRLLRGNDAFTTAAATVVRTLSVSRYYTGQLIDFDQTNKLFTTAQLIAIVGNSNQFTLSTPTLTADEAAEGLVVAWKKTNAKLSYASNGNVQTHEKWVLAKWDSTLYDPAT